MEVKPEYQQDPSALGRLYIHSTAPSATPSSQTQSALVQSTHRLFLHLSHRWSGESIDSGRLVPLSTVATYRAGVGPLLVNHLSQLPRRRFIHTSGGSSFERRDS